MPDDTVAMKLKDMRRKDLYVLFKELGFTLGCEIGVNRGINAKRMLNAIPDLKLHLVDSWAKRDKLRETHNRLEKFVPQIVTAEMLSMDAVRYYNDEFFDFVYIDADHAFDFVMQDIIEWSKKVKPGGIVSGHDYYKSKREGVAEAVKAYTSAHRIRPWFVLDNEKRSRRPYQNSYFWIKE